MVATPKPLALVPVPAPAGEHAHHGHEHSGHDHAGHGHHAHPHTDSGPRPRTVPRLSLIGLSALQRLLLALPAIGLLWLLTFWAMHNG